MKKKLAIFSSLVLTASVMLSGCGNAPTATGQKSSDGSKEKGSEKPAKTRVIKVANYFGSDHPHNVALREKFKPMVEKNSGGTLKVEIYDNNKLGAEKEFYDGVRNGTIEMGIPGLIMQADMPKMGVIEWPFLFKDYNHAKKVLTSPIMNEIAEGMDTKQGVHILAWTANGFRNFSGSKPLTSMDSFKGFRLRMPNIPNYIKLGTLLGANVTPLPLSEVFTALEQKVVDGQDAPIAFLRSSGWGEVQKYVLESNHIFSPNEYIINEKLWKELTPDQQKVLEDAAKASADYGFDLVAKSFEDDKKWLQEKGLEFTTPDVAFKKQMEDAVQPLMDDLYKQNSWGKDMVAKIKGMAN